MSITIDWIDEVIQIVEADSMTDVRRAPKEVYRYLTPACHSTCRRRVIVVLVDY